ncbi:DNA cytosine methyltransferase [Streptomyces sp. C1-2]|uniref:DNA cytosine methyltransferase n=1 Tax=Streptomyces sp. C1-2 TaxID=2720022 RepID=UPI0019CFBC4B|nr:DNA cytosine methyltransferase [Streptomyces sp. C1-2]
MLKTDGELRVMDWFCGAGGSSQGAHAVPGVTVARAANHWDKAIESHSLNFPETDHYRGDIREAPVDRWPVAEIFWASPECPKWTVARGKKRDFHNTRQGELPGLETERDPADERSRALMEEVPQYLEGVQQRGGLVLAGVVENVIDCRAWDQWDRWIGELHRLGYKTRTIALNSMHAQPRTLLRAPQSRDRLYVAYWHRSLGRDPDWDKWLRPTAYCPGCDRMVQAMQVFKRPGADMGRYGKHGQYVYRCPSTSCRNTVVEPEVLPAMAAIDWSIPGTRIGDRKPSEKAPDGLTPKTLARIRAGLRKFAQPVQLDDGRPAVEVEPMLVPSGGTWRDEATSLFTPMPTRTTVETDALAVPPLLVPSEGRDGKEATAADRPMRAQTTRRETGLAWLPGDFEPFIIPLRGGGDSERARAIDVPLHAVTAGGNHHGLVAPPAMVVRNNGSKGDGGEHCTPVDEPMRTLTTAGHQSLALFEHLLVPYYGNGTGRPVTEPVGAFTTRDRWALVRGLDEIPLADVLYRMLEPHEIGRGMAFADGYKLAPKSKRDRVRLYGNAVTPPVGEVLVCALTEAITGSDLSRYEQADR